MHLKTTETHASLALAIVPPGNVLRDLAIIRGKLFTLNSLQGSRAWFDFPVLAWLDRSLDGGLLASLASSLRIPLEFGALRWEGNYLSLPIPEVFNDAIQPILAPYILDHQALVIGAGSSPEPDAESESESESEKWCPGPFPSAKGMICATLDEEAPSGIATEAQRANILYDATSLTGKSPRANVYSVALVELHWYPGPNYGSSWAILSSAVAGKNRTASRSAPVNSKLA